MSDRGSRAAVISADSVGGDDRSRLLRSAGSRIVALLLLATIPACWLALDRWTYSRAMEPARAALDRDGDGRVSDRELTRSSPVAVNYLKIDADGDRDLAPSELLDLLLHSDPNNFAGVYDQREPTPDDAERYFPEPGQMRHLRVLFSFMAAEIRAVDPQQPLPDEQAIDQAAASGALHSPQSQALLATLNQGYLALGLTPPDLRVADAPQPPEPGPSGR